LIFVSSLVAVPSSFPLGWIKTAKTA